MFTFIDKRELDELVGAPLARAQAILDLPPESFDLKNLITEANLKRVGLLSEKVGTACKFQKFRNGNPLKSKVKKEDINLESGDEESPQINFEQIKEKYEESHKEDSEKTMENGKDRGRVQYFYSQ